MSTEPTEISDKLKSEQVDQIENPCNNCDLGYAAAVTMPLGAIVGGIGGTIGGLIGTILTKDPMYLRVGAMAGMFAGGFVGMAAAGDTYAAELEKRNPKLQNQCGVQ